MGELTKNDLVFTRGQDGALISQEVALENIEGKPTIKVIPLTRGKLQEIYSVATNGTPEEKATEQINDSANYLKDEIRASIEGHRAEPRSVDTGEFLNSVEVIQEGDGKATIQSDVPQADYMEYGTSFVPARRHFNATAAREANKIANDMQEKMNKIS